VTTGTDAGPDRTVLVTGAAGVLGRRVLRLVAADPAVERIIAVDLVEPPDVGPEVEVRALDLATADLTGMSTGVDAIIHLAFTVGQQLDDEDTGRANAAATSRVLAAAASPGWRTSSSCRAPPSTARGRRTPSRSRRRHRSDPTRSSPTPCRRRRWSASARSSPPSTRARPSPCCGPR
jgi:nucleoside-diphosphate-sugar epimerase